MFANIAWKLKEQGGEYISFEVLGELPYPQSSDQDIIRMKVPEPKKLLKSSKLLYPEAYYQNLLTVYFRLDIDLEHYYEKWRQAHQHFERSISEKFNNIRQLNQDPLECFFSFICSQNNHISRISSLVEKLCTHYGKQICEVDGETYFTFPNLEALAANGVESHLRDLGFGYRAKYIQKAAEEVIEKGGLSWYQHLTNLPYDDCHSELMTVTGIGPKVADCICLMSLNHLCAIPGDTHVFQIAKHYLPELATKPKSMTLTLYRKIGNTFRQVYGEYSGWAQTVLFCADLNNFKNVPEKEKPNKRKKA